MAENRNWIGAGKNTYRYPINNVNSIEYLFIKINGIYILKNVLTSSARST